MHEEEPFSEAEVFAALRLIRLWKTLRKAILEKRYICLFLFRIGVVRHVYLSSTKMLVLYRGGPGNELFAVACNLTA